MSWLWTDTPFVHFGPAHLAALGLTAALAIILTAIARRLRGRGTALGNGLRAVPGAANNPSPARNATECVPYKAALRRLSRAIAVAMLLVIGSMQVVMLLPEHFLIYRSLPLQICDIGWMVAIYALWSNRRWAFALVYYWGLSATVLAMLTPDLKQGFPHFYFLMFYIGHGSVVVAAVYLCWGVGLRPDWRLYRFTALVTIAYAVCIYFVNDFLGTNYFCVNDKPAPGTMLDYFGPYPMHIAVGAAIALTSWAALTWPWRLRAGEKIGLGSSNGERTG